MQKVPELSFAPGSSRLHCVRCRRAHMRPLNHDKSALQPPLPSFFILPLASHRVLVAHCRLKRDLLACPAQFAHWLSDNVHQVHEAPGARRQPGEGVSTALPKLLPFKACGGKQRNALRGMNLVLSDGQCACLHMPRRRGLPVPMSGHEPRF